LPPRSPAPGAGRNRIGCRAPAPSRRSSIAASGAKAATFNWSMSRSMAMPQGASVSSSGERSCRAPSTAIASSASSARACARCATRPRATTW
jgi:hypothetical protein